MPEIVLITLPASKSRTSGNGRYEQSSLFLIHSHVIQTPTDTRQRDRLHQPQCRPVLAMGRDYGRETDAAEKHQELRWTEAFDDARVQPDQQQFLSHLYL